MYRINAIFIVKLWLIGWLITTNVFFKTEMKNERNINFLQNNPLAFHTHIPASLHYLKHFCNSSFDMV